MANLSTLFTENLSQGFLQWQVLGVGLGAMLVIFGIAGALRGQDPVLRRIAAQSGQRRLTAFDAGLLRPADSTPSGVFKGLIPTDEEELSQVRRGLSDAGFNGPHAVRNYYLIRAVAGLGMPMVLIGLIWAARSGRVPLPESLASTLLSLSPMAILEILSIMVGIGFFGPTRWIASKVSARRLAIRRSFPNVLDLLQISVESGLGLDAAMIRVANETVTTAPEVSAEFLIAQREIQAGKSRDKALTDMANRTGVPEVNSFVGVVLQSLQFGASISDALTTYSEEMRVARELEAQEMANKLPVKMSAAMAGLMLPVLFTLAVGPAVIRYVHYFHS